MAQAIVVGISNIAGKTDGTAQIDMSVFFVGAEYVPLFDQPYVTLPVQVVLDPTGNPSAIQNAMTAAIRSFATKQGITIPSNGIVQTALVKG